MLTVPGIKIFMHNLNNYLNYTGDLDLGRILKMFLPLFCLRFPSMKNMDIYPKTQHFTDLSSRPLSFWNYFPFYHLMPCTTFHAGKSIFQDIFCLRKIPCLLAILPSDVCTDGSSERMFKPVILWDLAQDAKSTRFSPVQETQAERSHPHKTACWAHLRLTGDICYAPVDFTVLVLL